MIDSHCHLADPAFAGDLDEVIARAREAGVTAALCLVAAGDDREAVQAARVAAQWPAVRFAMGVHPHQAAQPDDALAALVERVSGDPPHGGLAALGEMGLDYHYAFAPPEAQRQLFARQVALGCRLDLPLVIHAREADRDVIAVLRQEGQGKARGVFHCFTGSVALARQALDLGFFISFAGIVTFRGASAIRAVAAYVPLDRLLVETDCPYLAPVPFRGRRNEPAWLAHVRAEVATLRGLSPAALDEAVTANFESLFGAGV